MNLDVVITVRVDTPTAAQLIKIAKAEQRTLAAVARRLIEAQLKKQQKEK